MDLQSSHLRRPEEVRPALSDALPAILMTAIALALLSYPALRMFGQFEINYNEGWNAYHQMRAIGGEALYRFDSPYVFNNYPPLSFYVVGVLGEGFGGPVLAGRMVSIVSVLGVAVLLGLAVRDMGGRAIDGVLAGACWVCFLVVTAHNYIGMNDPQMLGHLLMAAGLAVYVRNPSRPSRLFVALLCFWLALLVKHTLLAIPLAVGIDLLFRSPRLAGRVFAAAAALSVLTALALYGLYGAAFFEQLLAPREFSVVRAAIQTIEFLVRVQVPLVFVAASLTLFHRGRHERLVLVSLGLGLALGVVYSGGAGTSLNVFFDVLIALALGAGLIAARASTLFRHERLGWRRCAMLMLAGFVAFAPALAVPRLVWQSVASIGGQAGERERAFAADIAFARSVEGPTICNSLLVCFTLGRPFLFDPFNSYQAMMLGRVSAEPLLDDLRSGRIALVQIGYGELNDGVTPRLRTQPRLFTLFSEEFLAVLQARYRIAWRGASGAFLVPHNPDPT